METKSSEQKKIATGAAYSSKVVGITGIQSVKTNAPKAEIVET